MPGYPAADDENVHAAGGCCRTLPEQDVEGATEGLDHEVEEQLQIGADAMNWMKFSFSRAVRNMFCTAKIPHGLAVLIAITVWYVAMRRSNTVSQCSSCFEF